MRRLISLLAAVTLVAGPLATAGAAAAKEEHRNERREQPAGRGGERRATPNRQAPAVQPYRFEETRGAGSYDPRRDPRSEYRSEQQVDPRYDPRGNGPPPSAYNTAPRRGGYLGPGARGAVIEDYSRNRLRPPPRGYQWVQTPRGMALVSQSTGQVFDVVPY